MPELSSTARGAVPVPIETLMDTIHPERTPMAIPHAYPGMPVDLRPLGEALARTETTALVKNDAFEAIRLVLRKGQEVCHDRETPGTVTLSCIEGRVALTTGDVTHELAAGHWLYLMRQDPHTLRALEDSSLLLTVMFR
jgi:quercetin dioxygenase-like cupin family protein